VELDGDYFVDPGQDQDGEAAVNPVTPIPSEHEHGGALPEAGEGAVKGEGKKEEGEDADGEAEGLGNERIDGMAVGEEGDGRRATAGGARDAGGLEEAAGRETELLVGAGTGGIRVQVEGERHHGSAGKEDKRTPDAGFEAFLGGNGCRRKWG
jgi:hypothetical protein